MIAFEKFKGYVKSQPAAIAIEDESRGLTFGESDLLSAKVCAYLKRRGIGKEDFVMIYMDRDVKVLPCCIGVWRAGAAFVICDKSTPVERVKYIFNDCNCRLLLDEDAWQHILKCQPRNIWKDVEPHDAAFAIYTSGTTGGPKGILHEYGNIDRMCQSYCFNGSPLFDSSSFVAVLGPFSFIAFINMISAVLMFSGGGICIIPNRLVQEKRKLLNYFEIRAITVLFAPPSYLALFQKFNSQMKIVISSSENLCNLFFPSVDFYNVLASSESAFPIAIFKVDKPYGITPVGRPLVDIDCHIVNDYGDYEGDGEIGELYYYNPFLRGYINNRDLNEQVLDRQHVCHSNDMVRRLADGNLIVIGRKDNMLKVNGHRVEPSEVELAIMKLLGIKWCAVNSVNVGADTVLCAYYLDTDIIDDDAREKLSSCLPHYMIPSIYCQIKSIPTTERGKLDRKSLPKPDKVSSPLGQLTEINEVEMLSIVRKFLNNDEIGSDSNLISYGLSSLGAMNLSELFGDRISPADILSSPTVRKIINKIRQDKCPVVINASSPLCPIADNQGLMYIDWNNDPGSMKYNLSILCRFSDVGIDELESATEDAIEAHPFLKSTLEIINDNVVIKRNDASPVYIKKFEKDPVDSIVTVFCRSCIRPFQLFINDSLYHIVIFNHNKYSYLLIDIHHIIADGISLSILIKDIVRICHGGKPVAERMSAFDFYQIPQAKLISNEKIRSIDEVYDKLIKKNTLYKYPSSSSVKNDYRKTRQVEGSVNLEKLCAFSTECGITVNSLLHSIFELTIAKILRERNFVYSTVSHGRSKTSRLNMSVGMFLRTLPVVVTEDDFLPQASEYVKHIHERMLSIFQNEYYSYAHFVERFKISPGILFIYQGDLLEGSSLGDDVQFERIDTSESYFPIIVECSANGDRIRIAIKYDSFEYSEADMTLLCESFINVADSMMLCDRTDLAQTLSEQSKNELLELGRGDSLCYDRTKTVVGLFISQLKNHFGHEAVVDEESSITYSDLNRFSNQVAHKLVKEGVQKNNFVTIMVGRCRYFPIAALGIMKAGAAYVPIDKNYPSERINYMMTVCKSKMVIDEEWLSDISEYDTTNIDLSDNDGRAYMIFTSGSTGQPKGVIIKHAGLTNYIHATCAVNGITPDDRIGAHRTFSFDSHIEDFWPTLSSGATVCIMPERIRKDLRAIVDFIRDYRLSGCGFVTSVATMLYNNFDLDLRYISAVGEKLSGVISRKNKPRFINTYGPTECTDHISAFVLEDDKQYDNIPIGRPLQNGMCFILDCDKNLMPKGAVGELYFASVQLAEGYLGDENLTKDKFIDCPFIPGVKMYRTGDLCRWNEAGMLEYYGRIDNQIKVRGYRVEPGEIESTANSVSFVSESFVCVNNNQIILFFASPFPVPPPKEQAALEKSLIIELRKSLPDYMMPSKTVYVDDFPTLPNGKMDRDVLLSLSRNVEADTPSTALERVIWEVMRDTLKIDSMGVTDSFMSNGITSLDYMQLIVQINKSAEYQSLKNRDVNFSDFQKSDTIRELAYEIMNGETCAGYWINPPKKGKPIMVVASGYISDYRIKYNFDKRWKDAYNIFFLSPLFSSWNDWKRISYQEVLSRYLDLIKGNLEDGMRIHGLVGFSFGGDIAYRLAYEWNKRTGQKPIVIMGDTMMERSEGNLNDYEKWFLINGGIPQFPKYIYSVCLISVNGPKKAKNESQWRLLKEDIKLYSIDDEHHKMFDHEETYSLMFRLLNE